jgi:hypothetical protein
MVTVRKLEKLAFKDSTAWLGGVGEGNKIYIVFRYGLLQVFVGENGQNPIHHGKMIYNETISYFHESEMETAQMKELVASVCKFEDD